MQKEITKKVSLIRKITAIFTVFGVVLMVANSIHTYLSQKNAYVNECENNLHDITDYLSKLITADGEDFIAVKGYFNDNYEKLRIPYDFSGDYHAAYENFNTLFRKTYPDLIYGIDISFDELSDEIKKAYVEYKMEYWQSAFWQATASFDIDYTYFVYPREAPNVVYMIDAVYEETIIDGASYLSLGFSGDMSTEKYPMMWEAWNSGKAPSGCDIFNNEYGHTYAYYSPVMINGEKIGLVCADMSVNTVTDQIRNAVVNQMTGSLAVFLIGILIMVYLVRKIFLKRILQLEKNVEEYADKKDASLAEKIQASEQGNDEIRSLSDRFAGMITELEDYMVDLQRVTAEKERIGAELNVATQIQADMLPRIFPPFPERKEFDLYASMNPAKEVGGDFYDFFLIDGDHLGLVMADVSGKGVPAALFMVIAKTLIKNRALAGNYSGPGEVLADANNQLCEGNEAELFVTVWFGILTISTGHVIFASGGHEYPAFYRLEEGFRIEKDKHGMPLATMEGLKFRETETDLKPGERLFLYTDGVTEATNAAQELFGEKRMIESLQKHSGDSIEDMLSNVRKDIDAFVGDAPQFDDLTMLGLVYKGV